MSVGHQLGPILSRKHVTKLKRHGLVVYLSEASLAKQKYIKLTPAWNHPMS